MNGINAVTALPFVAPPSFEPKVAVTEALASVANATVRTSAAARAVFDQFMDAVNYSIGIAPLLVALMATMDLVRQMISLHKARLMGLTQDVRRVAVEACSHFLNLARCLISSISTLIQFSKIIPAATLAAFSTVAGAISCLIYSLHAIVEGVHLYRTMQITNKWDEILQDANKNPEQKIRALLLDLDKRFSKRERQNEDCLAALSQDASFQGRAKIFLEEQAKEELEKVLGKNAYQKIREVVQAARDGDDSTTAPEMVIKLQEAREHLQTKVKQHIINILIDVVAVAATVLGIIFPYVGVGLLCAYVLWTVFCVLFTISSISSIQEWWKGRALSNFMKERSNNPAVYEKVLKTIRKHVLSKMQLTSNHTEMLLSKERTKEFFRRIREYAMKKPEKRRIFRNAPDCFLIEALKPLSSSHTAVPL